MFEKIRSIILRRNGRYREAFGSANGRWVLRDLMRLGHVGKPTVAFDKLGRIDPIATAFNEGKRFMALHCASPLNMSDDEILAGVQQSEAEDKEG